MTFDPTSFTMPHMLLELWGSSPASRLTRGEPGERREFIARAMIDAVPMSDLAYDALIGSPGEGDAAMWAADKSARYRVYCQILRTAAGSKFESTQQNVHSFLPACIEKKEGAGLIGFYANCYTKKDFTISEGTYVVKNDLVKISCGFDPHGKIILTKCDVEDIWKRPDPIEKAVCSLQSLKDLFDK